MTLKSKFLKLYHKFAISDEWEGSLEDDAVKIADDYAIEFAEWCSSQDTEDLIHDLILVGEINKPPSSKKLLEIFKNEKEL